MLSIWWDIQEIVYYELIDNNEQSPLISTEINFENSFRKKEISFLVNGKGVIINHNNIRPQTAQLTKALLEEFGRKNCFMLHILLTLFLLIITYLGDYWIIWSVLSWHQEKKVSMSWSHILHWNLNNFTSIASINLLTYGIRF